MLAGLVGIGNCSQPNVIKNLHLIQMLFHGLAQKV